MPIPVNTRVAPSLHPDNVRAIEGFDDVGGYGLSQTEAALATAYQGLTEMWEARDAVTADTSWNEDRRIVELGKLAERKFAPVAKAFDTARANLLTNAKTLEDELTAPVVSKASSSVSAEIRRHVKDMSGEERLSFLQQAVRDGDETTLSALLGAPSYLSGMSAEMATAYVRQYRERLHPEKAMRLKAFHGAADLLMNRGALVHAEFEKAVGASPRKAAELRRRNDAATKALT